MAQAVGGEFNQVVLIGVTIILGFILYFTFSNKSTNNDTTSTAETVIPPSVSTLASPYTTGPFAKTYHTVEEVSKHNKREDCWIIVDNRVYDITKYIDEHPGGDTILNNAGADSSEGFHGPQHPVSVIDVLKLYFIGHLKTTSNQQQ